MEPKEPGDTVFGAEGEPRAAGIYRQGDVFIWRSSGLGRAPQG